MRDSKTIKKALVSDLVSSSDLLTSKEVDHFSVDPETLDARDDISDRHVCLFQGYRTPNITIDAGQNYNTVQEYVIQVYVQYRRQKGNEGAYEDLYADLLDDVYTWIQSLAEGNRIYTATSGKLRVPKEGEGDLFTDQQEPIRTTKSSYTQIYIETIRQTT